MAVMGVTCVYPGHLTALDGMSGEVQSQQPGRKLTVKGTQVAVTRNQPILKAPAESRARLGQLLFRRREELGFGGSRPRFYKATGVNKRYADDIENARRSNFDEPFLRHAARGYAVTYQSLIDVAWGKADELTRDGNPAAAGPPSISSPFADPARAASDRPWHDEINERRVALAARGITSPTGTQMFPGSPDDAKLWDGIGARLDIGDRVWFIADLRRRAGGRAPNSGTSVTSA